MTPKTSTNGMSLDFEESDLYTEVYKFVQQYMSRYDMSHDFSHILRVLGLAKHILACERDAEPSTVFDQEAIVLAALLHDVGDRKYLQPGESTETAVGNLLQDNGCSSRLTEKVLLITQNVSYSKESKSPAAVQAVLQEHPELGIVQDADRLDAIGAIGVGRAFTYGAAKAQNAGMGGVIEHFTEKLERLEGIMKTATGKELARERTERLKVFRGWWEEENGLGRRRQSENGDRIF